MDQHLTSPPRATATSPEKGMRFWLVIASLTITSLLVTMEMTVVSTALPTIVQDVGGQDGYIWIPNSYLVSITALQPLFGQLADVFGRRAPLFLSITLFILGCGLCGGAKDLAMLIAGRTIQGLGGAGVNVLMETIVCDLVPLKERGGIMGIVLGASALGSASGPVIAGAIVQRTTWRWIFYMNLPLAGVALGLLMAVYHPTFERKQTVAAGLARLDWAGNALFVAACSSALIGISWAGSLYKWSSVQVLAPTIIGLIGLVGFVGFETTPFAKEPMIPLRLFSNRTSLVAFILSFLHGLLTLATVYFMPLYFQSVLLSSPGRAGVQILPSSLIRTPFAMVGGILLSKWGNYRAIHLLSFALIILGLGLFSRLGSGSSDAEWVVYQIVENIGIGLAIGVLLPVVQAKLDDSDTARATATWSFLRSFGLVWGIVIPSVVFNNRFNQLAASRISDASVRATLANGKALDHATRAYLVTLPEDIRAQVVGVFQASLRLTWQVLIAFAGLSFLLVFLEEKVPLRTELETDHGIQADGDKGDQEKGEQSGSSSEATKLT